MTVPEIAIVSALSLAAVASAVLAAVVGHPSRRGRPGPRGGHGAGVGRGQFGAGAMLMTSLYKRASPRQAMVLRMIEGAVKNAAHAHPGKTIDDRMARSIAKRAAGTLTSQWKSVLAAPQGRSEGANGNVMDRSAAGDGQLRSVSGSAMLPAATWSRGASQVSWRTPLYCVKLAIGAACGEARHEGSTDRVEALEDVLRLLSQVLLADTPPRPGKDRLHMKMGDVMGPRR